MREKKKRYQKRNGLDGKQDKRDSGADRSKWGDEN